MSYRKEMSAANLSTGMVSKKSVLRNGERCFSDYNASNYLIQSSDCDAIAGASKSSKNLKKKGRNSSASCEGDEHEETGGESDGSTINAKDKHALYQRAVQSPKGDISYLHKFFLRYVGGRRPLHLREDFCGTALICTEWVRGDSQCTAVGLDIDEDVLRWGLQNNLSRAGGDALKRCQLFCGNVLNDISKARKISTETEELQAMQLAEESGTQVVNEGLEKEELLNPNVKPSSATHALGADMVCAFNYSCCCLQTRAEICRYFRQALKCISADGGIFAMDLYGGTSSEGPLKLRRQVDKFLYTWEQEDFDVIRRTTKISLHFRFKNNQGVLKNAFSYDWRLWTLPEIKECLLETGFSSVHFWIKKMIDTSDRDEDETATEDSRTKYEEVSSFPQVDSWNAYIVAVAPPKP